MSGDFFNDVPARITYGGPDSSDPLAYAVYQPDRVVLGKPMKDHLRIAVRPPDEQDVLIAALAALRSELGW